MALDSDSTPVCHDFSTFVCGCCGATITVPISCGNRFCSVCSVSRRSRLKKRMKHLLKSTILEPKYGFRFLTMTIPNMIDPAEQLKILRSSFRKLRQRMFWKGKVKGGCVFYEVKLGSDGLYHIHLHAIIESLYLPQAVLSEIWQDVSPGRIVDIRWITSKAIIGYITKYTTKSDLNLESQIHASKLLKGCRLFQPFGTWHKTGLTYVHEPYQCPSCVVSDWYYVPEGRSDFDIMWQNAREPVYVPKRIRRDFQFELDLNIVKGIQPAYMCGVDYPPLYKFSYPNKS